MKVVRYAFAVLGLALVGACSSPTAVPDSHADLGGFGSGNDIATAEARGGFGSGN